MGRRGAKEHENPRARPTRFSSERRAPALRVTGASLSRGAGAPRSGRHRRARGWAFGIWIFDLQSL